MPWMAAGLQLRHFRDQLIAASLKRMSISDTGCDWFNFRDQLIAASLKHDRQQYSMEVAD